MEFAFARTSRFRTKDEERDEAFPHFRRYDAAGWARWKFYPGAILTFMSRLIIISLDGTILTLLVTLFSCGHDYRKGPIGNGCRKRIILFLFNIFCSFYCFCVGVHSSQKKVDFDYTYYLGPNYKKELDEKKRTSTIVSNHVSWLDPVVYLSTICPAFSPSYEFSKVPLLNKLMDSLDSIYIKRSADEAGRLLALQEI